MPLTLSEQQHGSLVRKLEHCEYLLHDLITSASPELQAKLLDVYRQLPLTDGGQLVP